LIVACGFPQPPPQPTLLIRVGAGLLHICSQEVLALLRIAARVLQAGL
jgi:hypothetical protein